MNGILNAHFNSIGKIKKLLQLGLLKAIEKSGKVTVLDSESGPFVTDDVNKLIAIAKIYWAEHLYLFEPARFGWSVCPLMTYEQYKDTGTKPKWNDMPNLPA